MSGDKGNNPAPIPTDPLSPATQKQARLDNADTVFGNPSPTAAASKLAQEAQTPPKRSGIGDLAQAPQQKTAAAQFYEQQQQQMDQRMNQIVIETVGKNAPPDVITTTKRVWLHQQVSDEQLAKQRSYTDFKQKDYYPQTEPARQQQNLNQLTNWEELQVASIGRDLQRAMSLYPKHEKEAEAIVQQLIQQKKITWGQSAPAPVQAQDGSIDKTAFWTWAKGKLMTLETVKDNSADLVNNAGSQYFQGLRTALQADTAAKFQAATNPPRLPHAARDQYLSSVETLTPSPNVTYSPLNGQAADIAAQDRLERMRPQFQGANNVSALARTLDGALQAVDGGDMNKAKQLIDDAKAACPSYAQWLTPALNQGRDSLLIKIDTLHQILETPFGQQSNPALERFVTPDLLRIVEAQKRGEPVSPTEATFGGVLCRYIKDYHTMRAFHNQPVDTHKNNIKGMIRAAARTRGTINQSDIDQLMSGIN